MKSDRDLVLMDEGVEVVSLGRTITEADILNFAGFSGDFASLHLDEEFARQTPFGGRIMHGVGTFAICSGLLWQAGCFGPPYFAFLGSSFSLPKPVLPGDTIKASVRIDTVRPTSNGVNEVVSFDVRGINQREEVVLKCDWRLMRPAAK